ncbi:MAG TPA: ABC transporter permease [Fimbriimonas sp.]|nr:ABC transporter permease [Fimbriimonas sp.]
MKIVASVIAIVGLYFLAPRLFEPQPFNSVMLWFPLILVVALGQLLVVASGGIDVSVGSILGCTAMTLGIVLKTNQEMPLWMMLGLCAAVGSVMGAINGALVAYAKLPPLIVTIGTLATFRGIAFLMGQGQTITGSSLPDSLGKLSNNGPQVRELIFNWLLIAALVLSVVVYVFLKRTAAGRAIYAVGSQPEAANRRGLSVAKTHLLVYTVSGLMAGIGGMIYASRFGMVQPDSAGRGLELTVIAAVAIAGTKLTGGTGSVGRVAVSALLLSLLNVALSVFGVNADFQMLLYGSVLLVAVCADGYARGRKVAA